MWEGDSEVRRMNESGWLVYYELCSNTFGCETAIRSSRQLLRGGDRPLTVRTLSSTILITNHDARHEHISLNLGTR